MVQGWDQLAQLNREDGLSMIGYTLCWNDEDFIQAAMARAEELLKEVLP